ncbi:hypothetical protein OX283_004840 [Flavobacterium sp. SUN052]|uniref:hypothetical protein n=1 Tax=Flavobacterium sp. SUN052 TaxID=3002441 RepID=UPI00237E9697|nr:hypothetical protein [Flavobacterium sp. SUN052]MEC4003973.1 hypothetical protein [Flavobacterium sp. SUN052]
MTIEEIEAMLPDFSNELLDFFESNQQELKAITVQEIFKIISKRKISKTLNQQAKKPEFWQGVWSNMHLFLSRIIDEIKLTKVTFTKAQKIDYFFYYLDRETND